MNTSDESKHVIFMERLRRRLVANCLAPFDGVNLRTIVSLVAESVLKPDGRRLEIPQDVVEVVSNSSHPLRIALPPGPMIVHRPSNETTKTLLFPVQYLLAEDRQTRVVALQWLNEISLLTPEVMSPRARRLLAELAEKISSTERGDWGNAAVQLSDCLDVDILFNISGVQQCLALDYSKGIPEFLKYVLRPQMYALDSLKLPFACPTAQIEEISKAIASIGRSSSSVSEVCGRFFEQLGHLPLTSALGLSAALKEWQQLHDQAHIVEPVMQWASTHPSPFATFHACMVCLNAPEQVPPNAWQAIAAQISAMVSSLLADTAEADLAVAWELRNDLAKHFIQTLEPMAPGQDERGAALAWWLADRFATALGPDNELLESVRTITVQKEEMRSSSLWLLCRPPCQPSYLRFATLYRRSPWGYAILSAIDAQSAQAFAGLEDTFLADRICRGLVQCLLYPVFAHSQKLKPLGGDADGIVNAAKVLALAMAGKQSGDELSAILEIGQRILNCDEVLKAMRDFDRLSPHEQFLFTGALCTFMHSDSPPEQAIWDLFQETEWRAKFLNKAPLVLIEQVSDGVAFLAGQDGRWRTAGPHYFALGALGSTNDPERRQALFALTVLVSLAAGTTSAVQRVVHGKTRWEFRDDIAYWTERIREAYTSATPWVQARLRSMQMALGFA